ncbi:MAG: CDP-alcohol phosphatidyltransferase family protein [Candidatus Latescibacteria bacterium]|nr:CDP-alcohol phosphatidyltransferase family protein [Candidatus Latescibacterota bacterium]
MPTYELTFTIPTLTFLRRNAANLITAGRILFLFLAASFAVSGELVLAVLAIPLVLTALLVDWVDGYVARRYKCETTLGGLLDLVGDRIVENVCWMIFAWLRLIPLWVPVVVVSRGFLTDAIRSYALSKGRTAFGKTTMMRSRIGYSMVASRPSRGVYNTSKIVAFGGLFTLNAVQQIFAQTDPIIIGLESVALVATYIAVALCVIRGIPVVTELLRGGSYDKS